MIRSGLCDGRHGRSPLLGLMGQHVRPAQLLDNRVYYRLGAERKSSIGQYRTKAILWHTRLEGEQRTKLGVPILVNHKGQFMLAKKLFDVFVERKSSNAHVINLNTLLREKVDGFAHRGIGIANRNNPDSAAPRTMNLRCGNRASRSRVLCGEAVHHLPVFFWNFRVAAELIVPRASREVGALRVYTWKRSWRYVVFVLIRVTIEPGYS